MGSIEIKHLKLIDTIDQVGTLKRAAKKLYLTQSALSHQLRELETRLEIRIFHRVNNQLVFTPAGKAIREASEEVLERMHALEGTIQEIKKDDIRDYIHGYSDEETARLNDQAKSISQILHWDSKWDKESLILEAGCGVGAQTRIIAPLNPESSFVSIDLSSKSLKKAKESIEENNIENVTFKKADIFQLPFKDAHFDHVFLCFVLEHLSRPMDAVKELKRVLKPEGTITLIEGDHGSTYFHPDSENAKKLVEAQVTLQRKKGGNANIGRELYPILYDSGFCDITVSPRQVYVDDSKPELVEGFIKNTFTAMIKGISEEALAQKVVDKNELDAGIQDLYRTAEGGGTFCYTFFKAKAKKA
ncbi:methyltransferase domain-containing protein [Flavobacteriaceae bacterium TP-CH-4]|uniref:Methyltransferase domain-containing protein n=1 Tax=Pelagihabitans pacificus TaxID=2696054 RepID=A0A967EBJ2_9FLAO|nr:methyltransferase domain-containing protein [Pelagihabitans pacificus]NHF60376.1 methyltransferase domain-containing protein [Pelagihabitans pacificus]